MFLDKVEAAHALNAASGASEQEADLWQEDWGISAPACNARSLV